MRTSLASLLVLSFLLPIACKSSGTGACTPPQAHVETVAKQNPECTRLTVHCTQKGAAGPAVCASTAPDKIGKPSDPEDLQAMKSGQVVVLEEGDALDITVPIMAKDGVFAAACGVTLKTAGMSRQQLIDKATAMAKAVEQGMCCADGSCCAK